MANPLRIAVITGSRAEYGLLKPTLRRLAEDEEVALQLIVTGSHLSPFHGLTVREIEEDGLVIADRVELLLASGTPLGTAKAVGLGVIGLAESLTRLKPDRVLLLGDRFEILAAAQAAFLLGIPVAHLHGGEITTGAFDDGIRHAVTKLSHVHLVAAEPYRRRVIQLGEDPARVMVVGAPALETIGEQAMASEEVLRTHCGLSLEGPVILVTYHPETLGKVDPVAAQAEMLSALEAFPEAQIIFSEPNADPGGAQLLPPLQAFVEARSDRCRLFASLGQARYLRMVQMASVVVGNSSSGIIEAPVLGTPTVNIGSRQEGRLRAPSVLDCGPSREAIEKAIWEALGEAWQSVAAKKESPYGGGPVSERIVRALKETVLESRKPFYDLPLSL